ncbi:MAG: sigma-54 dependent transcriptional regulator [Deltaproteobacteria bacterium]|nr:sigma-54 dependent transcriptional regulator [Kofleriaceae bacterium]
MDDQNPSNPKAGAANGARAVDDFRIRVLTELPDPAMRALAERVQVLAADRVSVLVCGESGVGKEIVARALHHLSPRARGPWLPVNCGAIPAGLIETELFGHERGAFSGASAAKQGLIEAAHGGTIFLDEIGELPLELQTRLLRFMEDRAVRRVGAVCARPVDVRVVAATNRDLAADAQARRFRSDLYFRLHGAMLTVPPLRDRLADIPVLAQHLLDRARDERNLPRIALSEPALAALVANPWPGNVRELEHAMELLSITAHGAEVQLEHLADSILDTASLVPIGLASRRSARKRSARLARGSESPSPFRPIAEEIAELEERRMREALVATGWIQLRAARLLRMSRRTFVTKMKVYGIRRP